MARKKKKAPSNLPTAAELRRLVRRDPKTAGRNEAISQLVELKPRDLSRFLTEVAVDEELDEPMRLEAVSALGRVATPTAIDGLREAIGVDSQTVRRRAIKQLGAVGSPDDLPSLKAIRTGDPVVQRTLRTSKLLLSYRHRLGEYRLDVPSRLFGADDGRAIDITTRRLTPAAVEEVVARVEAPGVNLVWESAHSLECGSNEFLFAVTSGHAGRSAEALVERQGLPAVLLSLNVETGRYTPTYYFATDPAGKNTFHIHGLRSTGRQPLYGTGTIKEGVVEFTVRATETAIEPPLTVTGTYNMESGVVDFEVAMTDPRLAARQQRLRKAPQAQAGPVR